MARRPVGSRAAKTARRKRFRKRRDMVLKKTRELSVLCGVEACAVIYDPDEEDAPTVWPSHDRVRPLLDRLRAMPEVEQMRNKMSGANYMAERIAKVEAPVAKLLREQREAECTALMFQCVADEGLVGELDEVAVAALAWTVDSKLAAVQAHVRILTRAGGAGFALETLPPADGGKDLIDGFDPQPFPHPAEPSQGLGEEASGDFGELLQLLHDGGESSRGHDDGLSLSLGMSFSDVYIP